MSSSPKPYPVVYDSELGIQYAFGSEYIDVPGLAESVTAGEIDSENATDGQVLTADGNGGADWEDIPPTAPAGANGQVQYNNNGLLGATDQIVWDGTTLTVGGGLADPSAVFMAISGTKGVVFPRMNNSQRDAISHPAEGLTIYNTQVHAIQYFNGAVWLELEVNPV